MLINRARVLGESSDNITSRMPPLLYVFAVEILGNLVHEIFQKNDVSVTYITALTGYYIKVFYTICDGKMD